MPTKKIKNKKIYLAVHPTVSKFQIDANRVVGATPSDDNLNILLY